ncbi:hypothetical protein ACVXHM_16535 [Pseudomonas aeruginosa]|nr:hypothetical protein [Pseudomonas aeruginosa]UTN35790.1 hypothetical protein MMZ75_33185 [Pseudomonas aeruginosa]
MRRHLLAVELDSDMDLTTLASCRVQIEAIANNRYRVSPQLKLYKCEGHSFVGRYLRRRAPQLGWYAGNASRPTGYFTTGNV